MVVNGSSERVSANLPGWQTTVTTRQHQHCRLGMGTAAHVRLIIRVRAAHALCPTAESTRSKRRRQVGTETLPIHLPPRLQTCPVHGILAACNSWAYSQEEKQTHSSPSPPSQATSLLGWQVSSPPRVLQPFLKGLPCKHPGQERNLLLGTATETQL